MTCTQCVGLGIVPTGESDGHGGSEITTYCSCPIGQGLAGMAPPSVQPSIFERYKALDDANLLLDWKQAEDMSTAAPESFEGRLVRMGKVLASRLLERTEKLRAAERMLEAVEPLQRNMASLDAALRVANTERNTMQTALWKAEAQLKESAAKYESLVAALDVVSRERDAMQAELTSYAADHDLEHQALEAELLEAQKAILGQAVVIGKLSAESLKATETPRKNTAHDNLNRAIEKTYQEILRELATR